MGEEASGQGEHGLLGLFRIKTTTDRKTLLSPNARPEDVL